MVYTVNVYLLLTSQLPKQVWQLSSKCWLRHSGSSVFWVCCPLWPSMGASQVTLVVKNPPANAEGVRDVGSIPGLERSSGRRHGNPLQYFAWTIPWTVEPGGIQSIGLHRVGHDWVDLANTHAWRPGSPLYSVWTELTSEQGKTKKGYHGDF